MYPLLLIAAFLPQISAYVDCKIACYRCRENKEHPLVLEVHCAMCNECKQRRRERLNGPTTEGGAEGDPGKTVPMAREMPDLSKEFSKELSNKHSNEHAEEHTKKHSIERTKRHSIEHSREHSREHSKERSREHSKRHSRKRRVKDESQQSEEDSEECPTPPPCESEEEVHVPLKAKIVIPKYTTTTTTQPTTTKKQCPPIVTCRKKLKKCPAYPCMPFMPMAMPMCMNMASCPLAPMVTTPAPQTVKTTDYHYVYVGVPKGLINQI